MCFFANGIKSLYLAIVPSSFITSHITALGFNFANLEISTDASVCPALSRTPPFFATKGKTWPGETISFLLDEGLMATFIVFDLSCADIPVEIPFFDSIETVKAVCVLDLFINDIKGKFSFLTLLDVKAKQIKPLPCFAIKLIFLGLIFDAGTTKSPSFSLSLLSTKINIFPLLASLIISTIDDEFFFISFINII